MFPFPFPPRHPDPSGSLVTKKRMERRTADGRLLSVTNTRTVHMPGEVCQPTVIYAGGYRMNRTEERPPSVMHVQKRFYESSRIYDNPPRYPSQIRHASPSVRAPPNRDETMRRVSVEYVDPRQMGNSDVYGDDWSRKESIVRLQTTTERQPPLVVSTLSPSRAISCSEGPLNDVIERINTIRKANGRRELVACPRLAQLAGEWACHIAQTGEFRTQIGSKMSIWRGGRPSAAVADTWADEAEEFGTIDYMKMDWLRLIGAGRAYCSDSAEEIVVVIYD